MTTTGSASLPVGWLRRHRVLLPGVSVLARQVSEVRVIAEKRLHTTAAKAARRADPALPGDLVATLKTPEGSRCSELERMRQPPTRTTGTAMKGALQRVEAFQLGRLKPPSTACSLSRPEATTGWLQPLAGGMPRGVRGGASSRPTHPGPRR
ncbi:hypothetical protein QMF80_03445 [Streptomyces sp. G-G2]|nr:hypothetical protein [Streptomyces sp. G-G2]MDJ0379899.1 hypothetical protein [Streptomyces sp. G-G2]